MLVFHSSLSWDHASQKQKNYPSDRWTHTTQRTRKKMLFVAELNSNQVVFKTTMSTLSWGKNSSTRSPSGFSKWQLKKLDASFEESRTNDKGALISSDNRRTNLISNEQLIHLQVLYLKVGLPRWIFLRLSSSGLPATLPTSKEATYIARKCLECSLHSSTFILRYIINKISDFMCSLEIVQKWNS